MYSYRVRFTKERKQRYLSHLELIKAIERAIRRAQLQMVYSDGFHPHPKFSFGPALAVGIASNDEYFDLELARDYPSEQVLEDLNNSLSEGLKVLAVKRVVNRVKPLNAVINRASYVVIFKVGSLGRLEIIEQFKKLLTTTSVEIVRDTKDGKKTVNIRPWLHNLAIRTKEDDLLELEFEGEIGSGGNLRPDDLLSAVSRPVEVIAITRTGLWHEEDGTVTRPLDFCDKGAGG